ncbi:hypothetical protein [Segniliparus rugosus]|uniref:TPR repeat domain-containing protein n=1 Tax=Segniliparus rugosus (strain ATCC BAA-974 / DSM 45345 / CCUG 50838 / CIP 108380 / JCM 13579 / CDC 945) TaxID=679197 RepID=E5XQ89_SEGRC|nr:hypothetical protein [Segniliparus rugosus]EFV13486.2 hypothetical protein HMPREF9336_01661 [Segniliparus rugosus ATCC BAA-974]
MISKRFLFWILFVVVAVAGCGHRPSARYPDQATQKLAEAVGANSHKVIRDLIAGADGEHPDDALIGHLLGQDWDDGGKAVAAVVAWIPDARGDDFSLGGQTAHAVATYMAAHHDDLLKDKRLFGDANPQLARALARAMVPYLASMVQDLGTSTGFRRLDDDRAARNTRRVLTVLGSDGVASQILKEGVLKTQESWYEQYAQGLAASPTRYGPEFGYSATLQGAAAMADCADHDLRTPNPKAKPDVYDASMPQFRIFQELSTQPGGLPGQSSEIARFQDLGLIDQEQRVIAPEQVKAIGVNTDTLDQYLTNYWRNVGLGTVVLDAIKAGKLYDAATV